MFHNQILRYLLLHRLHQQLLHLQRRVWNSKLFVNWLLWLGHTQVARQTTPSFFVTILIVRTLSDWGLRFFTFSQHRKCNLRILPCANHCGHEVTSARCMCDMLEATGRPSYCQVQGLFRGSAVATSHACLASVNDALIPALHKDLRKNLQLKPPCMQLKT